MDDLEAVQVANVVAELWPTPPMTDTRRAFYAKALTAIDDQRNALRAVEALFVSSKFQPTPGDVIDHALDLHGRALQSWNRVVTCALDTQAGRSAGDGPGLTAMAALRKAGYRLADLPVNHAGALHKAHRAFVERFVEHARLTAAGNLALAPHVTGALPAASAKEITP